MGHGEKGVGKVCVGSHRVEAVLNPVDHESSGDQRGVGVGVRFLQHVYHVLQGVGHTSKNR